MPAVLKFLNSSFVTTSTRKRKINAVVRRLNTSKESRRRKKCLRLAVWCETKTLNLNIVTLTLYQHLLSIATNFLSTTSKLLHDSHPVMVHKQTKLIKVTGKHSRPPPPSTCLLSYHSFQKGWVRLQYNGHAGLLAYHHQIRKAPYFLSCKTDFFHFINKVYHNQRAMSAQKATTVRECEFNTCI